MLVPVQQFLNGQKIKAVPSEVRQVNLLGVIPDWAAVGDAVDYRTRRLDRSLGAHQTANK